ncbi:unnamed protein product [Echinostoma caproni]|uniref:Colorectal cancer associated 2 n=1 Tax=Echinostoma caproni TaxID=27848 RepID=A0A183AI94_9TREM|nr:unnamed protein product [Echinostoma caproni]
MNEPKVSESVDFEVRPSTERSPNPNKEPIFPPPTYADPSASNVLMPQGSSSTSGPFEDYVTGKNNFIREYPAASNQALECGFTRYSYFHPPHSRDVPYRRDCADAYCTDSSFPLGLSQQSHSFSTQQPLSQTSWSSTSIRELVPSLDYGDPFLPSLDLCSSTCNGKYPDSYGPYATKPIPPTSHDYRGCTRQIRTEDLTVIPRTAGSSYTGVNPILASTYPVASGNRPEKVYGSCPQLSESTIGLEPTNHSNYRPPPTFSTHTVPVPDRHAFNNMNYL